MCILNDDLPARTAVPITFELVQHRFTGPAKRVIEKNYPNSKLVMNKEEHRYKWGRYGIGKYICKKEDEQLLQETIEGYYHYFPDAEVAYFT